MHSFRSSMRPATVLLGWFLLTGLANSCPAAPGEPGVPALADSARGDVSGDPLLGMSLEELVDVKVTSASKREETWFRTPAAVYVITADDIRRSGGRSLAEALRMVPGLEVARMDGSKWAVSARGFNARFAGKLLVLVDGHSVYTPLFSGVFWDAQETMMDDIERIEVIRGPGATLWGANAVNGVINIITKDSQASEDLLVEGGSGTSEKGYGAAHFAGRMGVNGSYRLFGLGFRRDSYPTVGDGFRYRDWEGGHGGFRMDWNPGARNHVTVTGSAQTNSECQVLTVPTIASPYGSRVLDNARHAGQSVMARLVRSFSPKSEAALQVNFDHTDRIEAIGHDRRSTLDLDLQHNFAVNQNNETVWGASYRLTHDNIGGQPGVTYFAIPSKTEYLAGAFLQHEVHTADRRAALVVGSKFEKTDFSDAGIQPNVRASLMPTPRQMMWGSVSRALRTPSRGERDVDMVVGAFPDPGGSGMTVMPTLVGTGTLPNEVLTAYEAGYRVQAPGNVTLDLAYHHDHYTSLRSNAYGAPTLVMSGTTPYIKLPVYETGDDAREADGVEVAAWAGLRSNWRLRSGYSYQCQRVTHGDQASSGNPSAPGFSPRHSGYLQSLLDLDAHWSLDGTVRYVDHLPYTNVPAYTELDARLLWHATPGLDLAVLGENLLHESHLEFCHDVLYEPAKIERSVQVSMRVHL